MTAVLLTPEQLEKLVKETDTWLDSQEGTEAIQRANKEAQERTSELELTEQIDAETLKLIVNC